MTWLRPTRTRRAALLALSAAWASFQTGGSVRAQAPSVTVTPNSVRVQVASAPLAEVIDALSRAAGFKVSYSGPRPTAVLFKTEIETPTVAEALLRLLGGENLNYGVVFDLSGRNVTTLMMLGPAAKSAAGTSGSSVPRPFSSPVNPRNEPPPADEEPSAPVEPEAADPGPEPPAPEATEPARSEVGTVPMPPSPFAPRPLVISPFSRPTPSPPPPPAPSPTPLP